MAGCSLATYAGGHGMGIAGLCRPTMISPFNLANIVPAFHSTETFGEVALQNAFLTSAIMGTGITVSAFYSSYFDEITTYHAAEFDLKPVNGTEGPGVHAAKKAAGRWIDYPSGYFPLNIIAHEDNGLFCALTSPFDNFDPAGLAQTDLFTNGETPFWLAQSSYCHKNSEDAQRAFDNLKYEESVKVFGVPSVMDREFGFITPPAGFNSVTSSVVDFSLELPPSTVSVDDALDAGVLKSAFTVLVSKVKGAFEYLPTLGRRSFDNLDIIFWLTLEYNFPSVYRLVLVILDWTKNVSFSGRSYDFIAAVAGSTVCYVFMVIAVLLGLVCQVIVSVDIDMGFLTMIMGVSDSQASGSFTAPVPELVILQDSEPAPLRLNPVAAPFIPARYSLTLTPITTVELPNALRLPRRRRHLTRKPKNSLVVAALGWHDLPLD